MFKNDSDCNAPDQRSHKPEFSFLRILLYLSAVLAVVAAVASLILSAPNDKFLICGMALVFAAACCVTAEVAAVLLPVENRPR